MRSLATALLLLAASGCAAQYQSPRRADPVLATLQGRYLRDPRLFPRQERLAMFQHYWIRDGTGKIVGQLVPFNDQTKHPTFRIANLAGASFGSLQLNRRTKSGWTVRNDFYNRIGRIVRMKVVAGEYDWRDQEDNSIAALVPVPDTVFYHLRGGDEIRTLFQDRFRIPLPQPAAARVRENFRRLHSGSR